MALDSVRHVSDGACPQEGQTCEAEAVYTLRAHDAWALPVEVLLGLLNAETVESRLFDDARAALIALPGRFIAATTPGLTKGAREHMLRKLLSEYLSHPWDLITLDDSGNMKVAESPEASTRREADAAHTHLKRFTDVRNLYKDSHWAPRTAGAVTKR